MLEAGEGNGTSKVEAERSLRPEENRNQEERNLDLILVKFLILNKPHKIVTDRKRQI